MSRRCTCSRLLAALKDDPRLRTLPLAARALWMLLADAMASPGFDGVLPFSETRRVSLLVSAPETEVETHLETLIGEGLIQREGEALVVPMLREAAARTLAARRNGAAGGRPRRGETPEQAAARRKQGELLMPIASKPSETERWATASAGVSPRTTTTVTEGSISTGWQKLAQQCIEVTRIVTRRPDFTPVRAWLEAGHSPEHILDTLEKRASAPGYEGRTISTLRYFNNAFLRTEGDAAQPVEHRPSHDDKPSAFQGAVERWIANGQRGEPPRLADFRAAAA